MNASGIARFAARVSANGRSFVDELVRVGRDLGRDGSRGWGGAASGVAHAGPVEAYSIQLGGIIKANMPYLFFHPTVRVGRDLGPGGSREWGQMLILENLLFCQTLATKMAT